MDCVIVGAGAVGAVVGALLHGAGHTVRFWVRPSQRDQLTTLSVERLDGSEVRIDAPQLVCPGDSVPPTDWVLICVRGEQLDAALRDVAEHMGADRRVAIAAVSLRGVTEQARAAGLTGPVYALHASFGSFTPPGRPNHYRWYPFSLPTTVTPDGDRSHRREARQLSKALERAGLPARARLTMTTSMRFLVAQNSVLALGWDLRDWDLPWLVETEELRRQTAAAMREAAPLSLPDRSPLRWLPRFAFDWFLRALPWFMRDEAREVWRYHGPKIRDQTDHVTRALLAEADRLNQPVPALRALFDRWRGAAGQPAPSNAGAQALSYGAEVGVGTTSPETQ